MTLYIKISSVLCLAVICAVKSELLKNNNLHESSNSVSEPYINKLYYNQVRNKRYSYSHLRPQSSGFETQPSLQQSLQNLQGTQQQQNSQRPLNQFGNHPNRPGQFGQGPYSWQSTNSQSTNGRPQSFSNRPFPNGEVQTGTSNTQSSQPQNSGSNSGFSNSNSNPSNQLGNFPFSTEYGQGNGDSSPPLQNSNGFSTNQFSEQQQPFGQSQNSQQSNSELPSWNLENNQASQQNNNQQTSSSISWTTQRNPLNVAVNENTIPEAECVRRCLTTNQYNPVCGTDYVTYSNIAKLRCAQQCGRQVGFVYNGICITTQAPRTK